jgi:hypothetical protein
MQVVLLILQETSTDFSITHTYYSIFLKSITCRMQCLLAYRSSPGV